MSRDVSLRVDGEDYRGWMRVDVFRTLEAVAGSFDLGLTENWPNRSGSRVLGALGALKGSAQVRPLRPGQDCAVLLGGDAVITGHLDLVEPAYDAQRRDLTVQGRDATGDLVDCSVLDKSGEWKGKHLAQIAELLCTPFGIDVRTEDIDAIDTRPFSTVTADSGDAVFDVLERLARQRGLLLMSDGRGALLITRPAARRVGTALERGVNILSARGEFNAQGLYSRYVARGQDKGSDTLTGKSAASPEGQAFDSTVPRYRPLVVVAEQPGGIDDLRRRAAWERAVRMGRSVRVAVTVQGWEHDAGLWEPNARVALRDDWLHVDEELLIVGVRYLLDDGGTRCEMTLSRPEAFDVLEEPENAGDAHPYLVA